MATTVVSVDQVELAFRTDPLAADLDEAALESSLPYVRKLPEILAEKLDNPVRLEVLVWSLVTYFRYIADNPSDFQKAVSGLLGNHAHEPLKLLRSYADQLEAQIPMLAALIAQSGQAEEELIIAGPPAMYDEAADLLRRGELTLGRLLLIQPGVIALASRQAGR